MQALTVKVPWSFAIAHGPKRVENRSWPPPRSLRELAIHAGARSGWDDAGEFSPLVIDAWRDYVATLPADNAALPWPRRESLHLDFSAVVAVAEITASHAGLSMRWPCQGGELCSEWAVPGQYHWQLGNVRTLATPVPCSGNRKLWTLPDEVESAVRAQLARRA
jgi:hypothetical protein